MLETTTLPRARRSGARTWRRASGERVIDLTDRRLARPLLIVHSSDDMYGADRMLLEVIASLSPVDRARVVVWLPLDYDHGATPLCERLAAEGITCEHVSLPIVRRRYLNPAGLSALGGRAVEARRRIAKLDPSDVILATSAVLPLAPFLGWGSDTRVILHMQEVWAGREAQVLGALASRVDQIIAISEASRASLPEFLQDRVVVVPNGTPEPESYTPIESHSGELTFIVASRWNAWKGHETLLKAWDEAGSPGRLVILGGPPAMGAAVDVVELVAASARPDTIELKGEVADAGAEIDRADVMIVPSTKPEPFGLVTIEAFARQRPVVASANGGLLETVREGSGWLVEPGSPTALANRLRALTRSDVVHAGVLARRRYEQHYSSAAFQRGLRAALKLSGERHDVDLRDSQVSGSVVGR